MEITYCKILGKDSKILLKEGKMRDLLIIVKKGEILIANIKINVVDVKYVILNMMNS